MTDTKDPKKDTWKANIENFFHNYFIGISHLQCSNADCPIVENWDSIEEKNSKKGKCALYKITGDNFQVVDATVGNTTDLGTFENIEITLPSGNTRKTKPKKENQNKKAILESGYNPKSENKEPWLKEEEYVLFFNNASRSPNLNGIADYLEDLWEIKENIKWDRDKSKKKVFIFCESEPSDATQTEKISAVNKDYIFPIWDPSITNAIKSHEIYSPGTGTQERQQLHQDLKEEFSEMRRVYGIRHLTSKKEERQNNPEIELNEAQFIALERRKKRIREKSIKDAENKVFCRGTHTLTYGTSPEQREEKVAEVKQLEEIKEEPKEAEVLAKTQEK